MSITADNTVVLIPSGSASGPVNIEWNFPFEIMLEERTYKVGSTATFQRRSVPEEQLKSGSYSQNLTPGDVYEVRVFDRAFPGGGMSDAEKARWVRGEVVVHALLLPSELQNDFNERVGGTFYRYTISTGATPTHAVMEIGRNAPTADASGFLTMPNPLMTARSYQNATVHNLTTDNIFDLLPEDRAKLVGGSRVALIRVSDASGNWQQVERRFRTLDRKLTIDFHTVDVQSIGEPASETEGEMRFQLETWDHDGQNWSVIQTFVFDNDTATLAPFSVRDFVLDPVVVIGPRPVRDGVAGVAFHVREFDDWPFEDEDASSLLFGLPQTIRVVPGENSEDNTLNLTLRAEQAYDPFDPEESLIVDVRVTVKVEHVEP